MIKLGLDDEYFKKEESIPRLGALGGSTVARVLGGQEARMLGALGGAAMAYHGLEHPENPITSQVARTLPVLGAVRKNSVLGAVPGMVIGGAMGASIGASRAAYHKINPLKGAGIGVALGVPMGALIGAAFKNIRDIPKTYKQIEDIQEK